jgi:hypothetical protein
MGFAEGRSTHVPRANRSVHVGVLVRIANVDRKITGVKFDVLISSDAFDRNVAGGYA